MLSDREMLQVQKVLGKLKNPYSITVYHDDRDDDFSRNMMNFARQITGISGGNLHLHFGNTTGLPGLPAINLESRNKGNISYMAIPTGPELDIFLKTLVNLDQGHALISNSALKHIENVKHPAQISVLISPDCPNCPKVVQNVNSLAVSNSLINVTVIDIGYFTEIAGFYSIKSVPATFIDDEMTFVGQVSSEELALSISMRGTMKYLSDTIKSMLFSGRVLNAVSIIMKLDDMEAIMPLYLAEEMQPRMSILMALEEALEIDQNSLDRFIPELLEFLSHSDYRIRGDTADLLGKIGSPEAMPRLKDLVSDENEEVAEAAKEALEEINKQIN